MLRAVSLLLLLAGCAAAGPADQAGGTDLGCEVTRPQEGRFLPFGRRAARPVGAADTGSFGTLRDDSPEGWSC
jgi:hypothetical protein